MFIVAGHTLNSPITLTISRLKSICARKFFIPSCRELYSFILTLTVDGLEEYITVKIQYTGFCPS